MHVSRAGAYAAGVATVLLVGTGTAVATNGSPLLIGKGNAATATTGLTNTKGVPLSLAAKKGAPPLKVNSTAKVKNLNSDLLDGKDSSAFLPRMGKAHDSAELGGQPASAYVTNVYAAHTSYPEGTGRPKPDGSTADTVVVPAGTYEVTFNAEVGNSGDGEAEFGCQLAYVAGTSYRQGMYGNTLVRNGGYGEATVVQLITLTAPSTTIAASCHTNIGNTSHTAYLYNSTLLANQVHALTGAASTAGTKPLSRAAHAAP